MKKEMVQVTNICDFCHQAVQGLFFKCDICGKDYGFCCDGLSMLRAHVCRSCCFVKYGNPSAFLNEWYQLRKRWQEEEGALVARFRVEKKNNQEPRHK